ncbi:MAG: rod shape-determining protein [Halanaerobiaceae bacterium]
MFDKRFIGISITKRIKVYEKDKGVIFNEPVSNIIKTSNNEMMNVPDYWLNKNDLEKIIKSAVKIKKYTLRKPKLIICLPHELTQNDCKKIVLDTVMNVGFSEAYIVDNLTAAAVGSNISIEEMEKKIFIYNFQDKYYISLIYAGGIIKVVNFNSNSLENEDILLHINELLTKLPADISNKFSQLKDKKQKEKLLEAWKDEHSKTLYLCVSDNNLSNIDMKKAGYMVKKMEYNNCLINGVKKIINTI